MKISTAMRHLVLMFLGSVGLVAQTPPVAAGPDLTTTTSGLQYFITSHGDGPGPKSGQVVVVHYTGTLPDGTVFDSSFERKLPFAFTFGKAGMVIKGWQEGFGLLHVGDRATLIIPPALAYGERARGKIPANSTLRFDVEFLALKDRALADALQEVIDRDGLTTATMRFADWKATNFAEFYPDESQLNLLGYRYLGTDKVAEAIAVLRWNAQLFPRSANVYDSLGEALLRDGQGDQSIANYEKSLQLDPNNKNAVAMLAELKSGPGAVETMRRRMAVDSALQAAVAAQESGRPVDLGGLRRMMQEVIARSPAAEANAGLVQTFFHLSEAVDLAGAVADWKLFAESTNPGIREMAAAKLGLAEALQAPLQMKFKAIDGREVDLAALRGKVVLVDFWATWCGPCVAEIPNIVATYGKLHDQGFEIVGITLDQAPDPGQPTQRQKSAAEVAGFAADHGMTWPQYYDGKYWQNEFGRQYGIRSIPAMFLVDQKGMIVSTNARGPKLEKEVRRLLGR